MSRLSRCYLVVEDHLTTVVCFVEEVQILQYGWIIEDSLHDVMTTHPRYLTHQEEGELMGRIDLPSPRLPLRLVLLLLQRLGLLSPGLIDSERLNVISVGDHFCLQRSGPRS